MSYSLTPTFKIVLYYFIFSMSWIFFSDLVISAFTNNAETIRVIQTLKGWFFVLITSCLLYLLIRQQFLKLQEEKEKLTLTKELLEESLIELKEKRTELETIFLSAPNPIKLFNEDGNMLMINDVWLKTTGYTFEEIDTIDKWLSKAYGKDSKSVASLIKKLFTIDYYSQDKVDHGTFKIKTKFGHKIQWQFSSIAFGMVNGKKTILASAMDVTDLKNKEKLILQQSKMAALGEMLENIAHQWRQPLSSILAASSGLILKNQLNRLDEKSLTSSLETINSSTEYLSKTIDDFRSYFQKDNHKYSFCISEALEKTFSILESKFKSGGILFIKDIEDVEIIGLENELIQVLMNILNNAKDALEKNNTPDKYIFITISKNKEEAFISIRDNGGGIKENIIDKIFDPYFTTKHRSQGTGIGLYMVEEMVVKHMKGSLTVENDTYTYNHNIYNGAKFTVKIPLS